MRPSKGASLAGRFVTYPLTAGEEYQRLRMTRNRQRLMPADAHRVAGRSHKIAALMCSILLAVYWQPAACAMLSNCSGVDTICPQCSIIGPAQNGDVQVYGTSDGALGTHPVGLVYVLPSLQLVFVPIPKSASSSWRRHILQLGAFETTADRLSALERVSYEWLAVVRNPVLRFLSGVATAKARTCRQCFGNATGIDLLKVALEEITAENLLDEHLMPQAAFLRDRHGAMLPVSLIVHLEDGHDTGMACIVAAAANSHDATLRRRAAVIHAGEIINKEEGGPRVHWNDVPQHLRRDICTHVERDFVCFGCRYKRWLGYCDDYVAAPQ